MQMDEVVENYTQFFNRELDFIQQITPKIFKLVRLRMFLIGW